MSFFDRAVAVVACAGALVFAVSANAAVVGASPDADLSSGAYVFDLGGGTTYTFADSGQGGFFGTNLAGVQTTGSATVASVFSRPTSYFTDPGRAPFIDGSLFASFDAYADVTAIPFTETDSFVALRYGSEGDFRYGFARIAGLTLFDIAFETTPNTGIQAMDGPFTNPAPVPLPAAMPMLLLGIGGLAMTRRMSRKV